MTDITEIDRAIARARARKAAKEAGEGSTGEVTGSVSPVTGRVRLNKDTALAAQKAAAKKLKEEERAAKKAERDAARALKKAEREAKKASRSAPHMTKVERAAVVLPVLTFEEQEVVSGVLGKFDLAALNNIVAHLSYRARFLATERATVSDVKLNDVVRIVSGNTKHVGAVGVVTKVNRIRCYVAIEAANKPVYLFTSDVEVLQRGEDIEPAATETTDAKEGAGEEVEASPSVEAVEEPSDDLADADDEAKADETVEEFLSVSSDETESTVTEEPTTEDGAVDADGEE